MKHIFILPLVIVFLFSGCQTKPTTCKVVEIFVHEDQSLTIENKPITIENLYSKVQNRNGEIKDCKFCIVIEKSIDEKTLLKLTPSIEKIHSAGKLLPHRSLIQEKIEKSPVVSIQKVDKKNNLMYWKGTTKLFTGKVVTYSHGFNTEAYIDGRKPDSVIPGPRPPGPPEEEELFPKEKAYQDAVREFVNKYGLGHNEYFFFETYGNESDLPVLLHKLKSMGETKRKSYICTRIHCLSALEKITGVRPGVNYSGWEKWYKEKYGKSPPLWFPGKKPENK